MMTKSTSVLTLALSLAHAGSILAQPGPRAGREDGPWDPLGRFEAVAPAIGEPMPDLTVHDKSGQELRLRELLAGHTTVLVLGCLT